MHLAFFFPSLNEYIYIFYFGIFIVIMVIIDSFIIPGGTVEVSFPFQTLFLVYFVFLLSEKRQKIREFPVVVGYYIPL